MISYQTLFVYGLLYARKLHAVNLKVRLHFYHLLDGTTDQARRLRFLNAIYLSVAIKFSYSWLNEFWKRHYVSCYRSHFGIGTAIFTEFLEIFITLQESELSQLRSQSCLQFGLKLIFRWL